VVSDFGLAIAADTVGIDRGTLRRWRWRRDRGLALARCRGPRPLPIASEDRAQAVALVRELRGLVGVEALRHGCPGLTRRGAARIKAEACAEMERERRASAAHVEVAAPGVIRGFDSMELGRAGHLLVCGDGAVPYRTSWVVARRYDGASVAHALAGDFARNGAPLVLRLDRARQHDVEAVRDVLAAYGVLPVHGPPRHPEYYGQHERLNRDQRAWLRNDPREVPGGNIDHMMGSLNNLWPRRKLGWTTAAQAWSRRPAVDIDRVQLRKEVEQSCRRLVEHHNVEPSLGWRLAVEHGLTRRGLLRVNLEAGAR
jgi:transposase InsO family protein